MGGHRDIPAGIRSRLDTGIGDGHSRWIEVTKPSESPSLIKWPIANSGVLMRTEGSAAPLVFVTLRDREVLDALAARGVPVDRSVTRLRQVDLAVTQ